MNVHKLKMDTSGNVEDISFVLARKNGDKLGNIPNTENVVTKHSFKEASEFTFAAHKRMNNNVFKYWDELKDFKLVWIPEWDMWYEATVEINEKDDNVKNVSGKTLGEAELSQIMLYGIEINTETDIARDDYEIPTTFYNSDHPEASLMNRLLDEKAPHYTIKHIDKSLMNLQRTFTFDDISLYDAFQEISEELDCLFIFGCGSDENGKPERTISVYDLEANCIDCGNRDTFVHKCPKCGSENILLGYGEYTNVFISKDNLADEITYSVDTDSVKNCFKLEAGDDLMTAAIRSCNPNGTDYIYYFPDETRAEMSQELQDKLKSYDALYEKYQSDYNFTINDSFVTNYNALINKYKTYEESLKDTAIKNPIVGYPKLMRVYFDTIDMVQLLKNKLMPPIDKPDNNAKSQGEYLMANLPSSASTTSLKNLSVSTADNIMVMLAQSIVKGVFKVTVTNTTLSNNVWKGKFNLENYSDKDDTFTSQFVSISINENYESYVKQRIDSILARSDENYYDIVGLFKQDMTVFKSQLKKYCLNTLQIFQKCCQSCIDMMVQQGISSNSTSSIYGINTKVLYENVYVPYHNKMNAIQDEIKVREDELYTVEGKYNNQNQLVQDGIQIEIERMVGEAQDALNFKNYIGTDLYKEFSSFIRMDKYSNENYISDGLNNTELMQNAIEFISVATKELFKSATLQHSITGTIKNFLRMKEFEPVTNNFKNGNWICVGIDDKVYQLRIIEYEIDFDDTQNISVTFSDVVSLPDGMSDLESILSNSSKMATSYSGVARQSTINTNFKNKMNEMIAKGLSMTNTKIVSNADNQDITWDEHGLLCREYDDIISDYTDSQLKIINHGIYITDDNWKTARAGIGNFIYYDPKDKTYKESYGVIADTLVSNLILTSEVGIYNEEKSIEMAKDGIIVTTNTMNKNVFTIRKEITDNEGNVSYERQLYIDDNGNIVLGGNASISWDNVTGTDNVVVKDGLDTIISDLQKEFSEKITNLEEQDDKKAETWYQETDPSSAWTTADEKKKHKGDLWYDTKNQVTKIYNGNSWENTKTTPPDDVFNKIDKKAQIFVAQPTVPYNKGDLWFNSTTSDIMTCVKARSSGDFNSSDWEKRNKYTDNSELTNFVENVYTKNIKDLQAQVDGQIETFYYDYEPTLLNYPASEWTSTTEREKHVGDLFYWKSKGFAYRFFKDDSTWKWQLVQDTDITKAMQTAEQAQNIANGKRRVFVVEPKPPYDIGDLWVQGTTGDLMRCKVPRSTGNYDSTDWEKATKYTDDSSLTTFLNNTYATDIKDIKNQIDGKIETYRQDSDPSTDWKTTDEKKKHTGDLWYKTSSNESFMYDGTKWNTVTSTIPNEVWSSIGSKAQIFTDTPTVPYNKGDLWVDGSDILTCMTSRTDKETYSKDDWQKKNSYTDDTTANSVRNDLTNLSNVLGYKNSKITGTYIYSPHIIGGELAIGDTKVNASISTSGKLTATGAEITGAITATSGSFTGTVNANSGTFTNVDIQSGKIGGLTLASNSIKSSNGNFSVTSGGKLTATDAIITGNITATSGSFTGVITATSLTLSGCKIDYNTDIENKPDIPDTTKFYRIGNSLSINPTGATSSFAVDSDGLLTAHNAVIFGTIHATNGDIGGFNITTTANNNDHAYKNTLYRIINGSDGYDYQAGIKGDSDSNTTIEAAFYVRKKLRNETWGDSTIPFFVRNDGYVYCENMSIGDSLYATGELSTKYDNLTTKFKIITAATDGVYFGLLDDTTKSRLACHTKGMLYELGVDRPFSIAKDGNLTYSIKKQGSINVDLGASGVNYRYRNLYIEKIIFPDDSSMTTAKTSGDASSYGSLTNKPGINGHTLASGNNTLVDLGIAARSHSHSISDISWSTTLGYKGFGHNHTMIYDGDGIKGISIAGSESPSYMGLIPYDVTYTNANSISLTRGGTMYLGAAYYSNKLTAYPFECGYFKNIKVYKGSGDASNIDNYITPSGGGSLTGGLTIKLNGTSQISSWKGASDVSVNITASSIGAATSNHSHDMSSYATTSWVSKNFATKGSGGGTTYYGGTGITISGTTISVTSNTYASYSHTHNSLSGGFTVTAGDSTLYPSGDGTQSCGSTKHKWKYIYATDGFNTGSDEYIKDNIKSINTISSIDEFYMSLNPIQYKFKQRPGDAENPKIHFGFGARETERHLNENNFNSEEYSMVTKDILDKPNFVGRTDEYSMNYLEFISLNTHMTQKAHHRIDSLESENQKLKNTIFSLQGEIAIIKQKLEELA